MTFSHLKSDFVSKYFRHKESLEILRPNSFTDEMIRRKTSLGRAKSQSSLPEKPRKYILPLLEPADVKKMVKGRDCRDIFPEKDL
jgi:hypothetical protein